MPYFPDIIIYLYVNSSISYERINSRGSCKPIFLKNLNKKESLKELSLMNELFESILEETNKKNIHICKIDATESIEEICSQLLEFDIFSGKIKNLLN